MQRERLYLLDILQAVDSVSRFLGAADKESFLKNELVQSAVLQKLTVIGEAVSRLPEELRARHPDIPWRGIAAFRNIAVHAYFSVDWEFGLDRRHV